MKYILLVFTLFGLIGCSSLYIVKNATGEKISVEISSGDVEILNPNECMKVYVAFSVEKTISFKTVDDNPTQIGDQENYIANRSLVVTAVTQDKSAVQTANEDLDCLNLSESE